jgi:hypothetical protein
LVVVQEDYRETRRELTTLRHIKKICCKKVNRVTYLTEFFVANDASEFEHEVWNMEIMGLPKK